jgi:hypothetical protein
VKTSGSEPAMEAPAAAPSFPALTVSG